MNLDHSKNPFTFPVAASKFRTAQARRHASCESHIGGHAKYLTIQRSPGLMQYGNDTGAETSTWIHGTSASMEVYMNRSLHCKNSATSRWRKLSLFEEAPCPQPARWCYTSYTLNFILWCARFHVRHTTARPSSVAYQLPGCFFSWCPSCLSECGSAYREPGLEQDELWGRPNC
jgi:hypothetical protein